MKRDLLTRKPKRTDIQALRMIAVLSVVIYHLWPHRMQGGFMGVDIFFVISGYLMTITILRDVQSVTSAKEKIRATGSFLATFYARRIKRLIPAAAVTLLATLGLVYLTGNLNLITKTADQVLASAFFVQNWKLADESTDYLAPSEPPTAVQHFWSLSLEEQFYMVWPLLLVVVTVATSSLVILYKKTRIAGSIIPIAILTVCLFIYGYLLTKSSPAEAYFVTPARVWELMVGGIIALLPVLKNSDLKLLSPWLGVAIILYALFEIDGTNFPGWHALIPVIGTALILYGGSTSSESHLSFTEMLKARPIQWVGDISYSLYLWHWPLIVLLPIIFTFDINGQHSSLIKLGILSLSFSIAWLSYKFIEQPPLRLKIRKRWIYLAFIATLATIGGISIALSNISKQEAKAGLAELHSIALSGDEPCFGGRAITNEQKCGNPFGVANKDWSQYTKSDFSMSIINDKGRWCTYFRIEEKSNPTNYCEYGDRQSTKNIVVWGDSHADHWVNSLDSIGRRNGIKFTHFSSGDCATDVITEPQCKERIDFIKNSGILQNSSAVLVSVVAKPDIQRIRNTLSIISDTTPSSIFLIEDVPNSGRNGGPDCLAYGLSCREDIKAATATSKTMDKELVNADVITQDRIIPTTDMFCRDTTCYSFIGGVSVYRDTSIADDFINSHISPVYSLSISPLLENKLRSAGALN